MTKEHLLKLTRGLYRVTERFPENEPLKFALREKASQVLVEGYLFLTSKAEEQNTEQGIALAKPAGRAVLVDLLQAIKALEILFALAKEQNWVSGRNFDILEREYRVLKQGAQERWQDSAGKAQENKGLDLLENSSLSAAFQDDSKEAGQNDKPAGIEPRFNQRLAKPVKPAGTSLESLKKPRHRKMVQVLQRRGKMQVQDFKKEFFPQVSKRTLRRDMDYLLRTGFAVRQGDKNNTFYKIKR